jgi:hypothetical protein
VTEDWRELERERSNKVLVAWVCDHLSHDVHRSYQHIPVPRRHHAWRNYKNVADKLRSSQSG